MSVLAFDFYYSEAVELKVGYSRLHLINCASLLRFVNLLGWFVFQF